MKSYTKLTISCFITATTLATVCRGEVTYQDVSGDASLIVIQMKVSAAAEPRPALKHRFVAEDINMKSGNAAPFYYRVLIDLPRRMEAVRKKYNEDTELSKWYSSNDESLPVEQLPAEKVQDAFDLALDGMWVDLVEATQRRECDFELGLSEIRGVDLIFVRLEEFQRSRELIRVMLLRTRLAIGQRRYDDAVETMRMNYRIARDFGSAPFLVSGLIGIAEAGVTNGTVIELIAAPDSPNLYWALSELPDPLVSMRDAVRFELDFAPRMFPIIHHAESTDRSPEEWNRQFRQLFRDLHKAGGVGGLFGTVPAFDDDVSAGFAATAAGLLGYTHAKSRLVAAGLDRERVEKMAVGQVLAIYAERNYQRYGDDWEKLWYMPYWEMRGHAKRLEKEIVEANVAGGGEDREVVPFISLLLPAMEAARNAQVRLEREIAALRVIEALRMHAAEHGDQLPAALDEIDVVPIPLNPATGRAFQYRLHGVTAILELPESDGIPHQTRRFEIQIAESTE